MELKLHLFKRCAHSEQVSLLGLLAKICIFQIVHKSIMASIIKFEGVEYNYINEEKLDLTVKLTAAEWRNMSVGDVLAALEKEGVKPEEIEGIYKVSAHDNAYSVQLTTRDTVNRLKKQGIIGSGNFRFNAISMSEQVVSLRIHWLPLYYDNRILKSIFCDFGEVLDVRNLKSSHKDLSAYNGTREVILKTDEVFRQKVPHLVKFGSGQSILVTMQGRPPLCLKCHEVGHTRRDCEEMRFSRAIGVARPPARPAVVPGGEMRSEPVRSKPVSPSPVGVTGVPAVGGGVWGEQPTDDDIEMGTASKKRMREEDDGDEDFIAPNKPARLGSSPSESESGLELENLFGPLQEDDMITTDVMNPPSLTSVEVEQEQI